MTDAEQREAARQFSSKWMNGGDEKQYCHSFWIELLEQILGITNVTEYIQFEKPVKLKEGDGKIHTRFIDGYIPSVKVLIEQKGSAHRLDEKERQSGGEMLDPFEQAKRYNDNLILSEKARWIVTCNFTEIWIYDMEQSVPEPTKIQTVDLQSKYPVLNFLVNKDTKELSHEMEISIKAGDIVGKLYDALIKQYKDPTDEHSLKSLNALCVRLVFCLYAEDAGIFGARSMFHDYLQGFRTDRMRVALIELFHVLDQKPEERDPYLEPELAAFPYVNGGLFSDENIEIPMFTDEIRELLLVEASENFNWSDISPTIFGAVFESTLNPETRRSGGMHYTSIENIHKVIDPLFLDDLKAEFEEIKQIQVTSTRKKWLYQFQDKLASLQFLDPACGSGNFLTETYLSLRRLENQVIRLEIEAEKGQISGQMVLGEALDPIKVSITQFHGIEINDFAVTVAKTALWIAESQMMKETEEIIVQHLDFLPLTTNANIIERNALQIDWNDVVDKSKINYIIGNPPFVGARLMSAKQKNDIKTLFTGWKNIGNLDYVSGWYKKTSDFITGTNIKAALVSTNSVSQGDSVPTLWKPLFSDGVHIDFAYKTFVWDSEATTKAHVHCVIIGFSKCKNIKEPKIYVTSYKKASDIHENIAETEGIPAHHINAYLMDANNVFVENRAKPLCDIPTLFTGSQRIDNDNYIFTKEEKDSFLLRTPLAEKYFYTWYGADEFINNRPRYCLWLGNCQPSKLKKMPDVLKLVENVHNYRKSSNRLQTRKCADMPTHFGLEVIPTSDFIIIPVVSSQRRRYIPMGFMHPGVLCSNQVNMIPNANLYHLGILESNVHMAWVRAVCGRLKSDYRYSKAIVYNNFPWPSSTDEQKARIEQTAQGILDARALYPDCSLADLYDPLTMPTELQKAHTANDRAVMAAYGFSTKMSESDCVAELMKMYQKLAENS